MIQIGIPELFIVILIALFSVKPENIQSYVKSFYRYILLIQNFFTNTKEDLVLVIQEKDLLKKFLEKMTQKIELVEQLLHPFI